MGRSMIVVFVSAQTLLAVLELWDLFQRERLRRANSGTESRRRPAIGRRTFLFLFVVTGVFFLIQVTGSWLSPGALDIFDWVRQRLGDDPSHKHVALLSGPGGVVAGLLLFYIAGFWDYVVHRYFSHSRWFWATHEYHHLPRRVSIVMPGILTRPFAFVPMILSTFATAATVYVPCVALEEPLWDIRPLLPCLLFIVFVLTASHSSFLRRFHGVHQWVRWTTITTPHEHLLHHAVELQGNFGNFTTLWDRVFGTYIDPVDFELEHVKLGLGYDQDFLGTITFGKLKLPRSVRDRYQVGKFCNIDETRLS